MMAESTFFSLPVNSDEGFPQSFRLTLYERIYRLTFYVNATEAFIEATPGEAVLDLPRDEAFMVLRVDRESGGPTPTTLLQTKLVPGLEYAAAELALRFSDLRVARRNLNGVGPYGSSVKGGVRRRWVSSSGIA
jgi:hypothetical protein